MKMNKRHETLRVQNKRLRFASRYNINYYLENPGRLRKDNMVCSCGLCTNHIKRSRKSTKQKNSMLRFYQ